MDVRPLVIAEAVAVIQAHRDLLTAPLQQRAQDRQMAEALGLMQDRERCGAAETREILSRLSDCAARLALAAGDTPGLWLVRATLIRWRDALTVARDQALTASIRRGPARRREPSYRERAGWPKPDPQA